MRRIQFLVVSALVGVTSMPIFAGGPAPAVPEPGTWVLMGTGAVALILLSRYRRR